MNLPDFFFSNKFFRKSGFIRRHTISQKDFEQTCADYRISGEKGFASRLSNSLDWWGKAHFLCLCQRGAFTAFQIIVTTCKQYQVICFFFVKSRYKAGQAAEYSIYEVVQRWISPKGSTTTVARLRGMSMLCYDQWAEYSDMEVRKNNRHHAYNIAPMCTYLRQRFIPELKRNGFKGDYHDILPYDLFTAIFSDSRSEKLLKSGQ